MGTEAVEAILARGGDADDVLRAVVAELAAGAGVAWAGIRFVEGGSLVLGPSAGSPDEARSASVPILYRGVAVGELEVHGDAARPLLERVADLVSAHVLLGWDTGGEGWEP